MTNDNNNGKYSALLWHIIIIALIAGAGFLMLRRSMLEHQRLTEAWRKAFQGHLQDVADLAAAVFDKDTRLTAVRLENLAAAPEMAAGKTTAEKLAFLRENLDDFCQGTRLGLVDRDAKTFTDTAGRETGCGKEKWLDAGRPGRGCFDAAGTPQVAVFQPLPAGKGQKEMLLLALMPRERMMELDALKQGKKANYRLRLLAFDNPEDVAYGVMASSVHVDGMMDAFTNFSGRTENGKTQAVDSAYRKTAVDGWGVMMSADEVDEFSRARRLEYFAAAVFWVMVIVMAAYAVVSLRLQKQKREISKTLQDKFTELYVAHERQKAAEKELERQLQESKTCSVRLHTAEELLEVRKRNRADLYHAINSSPVALVIIDEDLHRVVNCNDTAVRMFAAEDKQGFIENFLTRYLPEIQPNGRLSSEYVGNLLEETRRKDGGDFECEFLTHDREPLPLWVSVRFMTLDGQKLRVSYLQDLRSIRGSQDTIRSTQREIEQLIESLPVAVEIIDADSKECVFANRPFLDMFRFGSLDACKKQPLKALLAATQKDGRQEENMLADNLKTLRDERSLVCECTLQRNDGTLLDAVAYSQFINYQGGECVLTVVHDITARNEDEDLLIHSIEAANSVNDMRARFMEKFSQSMLTPLDEIYDLALKLDNEMAPEMRQDCRNRLQRKIALVRSLAAQLLDWEQRVRDMDDLGTALKQPAAAENASEFSLLLVEDNPLNRLIALDLLRMNGINCDEAADGNEAVQAVQAKHYDAVLMDIYMPLMDGDAATKEIRSMGYQMPVIAMTSNPSAEDRERFAAAGITKVVDKPINVETLFAFFRELFPEKAAQGLFETQA